jgi:hypothetical protein
VIEDLLSLIRQQALLPHTFKGSSEPHLPDIGIVSGNVFRRGFLLFFGCFLENADVLGVTGFQVPDPSFQISNFES